MTSHAHPRIDVTCIVAMHMAKCPAQTIVITRHSNDVDVVRHKAIGPDLDPGALCALGQKIKVKCVIAILEKCLLAAVPTLRDMVRNAGQNHSCET